MVSTFLHGDDILKYHEMFEIRIQLLKCPGQLFATLKQLQNDGATKQIMMLHEDVHLHNSTFFAEILRTHEFTSLYATDFTIVNILNNPGLLSMMCILNFFYQNSF